MRMNVSIAATAIGGFAFITPRGTLHPDAGGSFRGPTLLEWHRLLRRTCSWGFARGGLPVHERRGISSAQFHLRWACVDIRSTFEELSMNRHQNRPCMNL